MKKNISTEEEVKEVLGIADFRNVTKDKIIQFVSMMPTLDKELAIKIIEQFPEYASMATSMVNKLIDMCNNALKNNRETEKEAIEAYKCVLETIRTEIKEDKITPEEREKYNRQMIEVADKISEIDTRSKKWHENIIKYGSSVVCATLVLGAVLLGVNSKKE